MMNELITVTQQDWDIGTVQTIDARELHSFLEVSRDFSNWIKQRIDEYGFVENQDFVSFRQNGRKPQGGRPGIEYHVSIDMAKELAMVERNDKGREARRYFIECERRLQNQPQVSSGHETISLLPVDREFRAAKRLANAIGFKGNQATFSANKVIKRRTGVDCMAMFGVTHTLADEQDVLLTATEIGQRIGLSSRKINPTLESLGLVKGYRDHKDRQQWELTEDGQQYGRYLDTGKKHSDGTPVRQIKWNSNVVDFLKAKEAVAS